MTEPTMTTINGGEEVEITLLDGSKETVKVRQLPARLMTNYSMAIADDAAAIELYCDKEKGWAEKLTADSLNAVADKGLELNLDFFGGWFRRQQKIAETMNPGVAEKIQRELSAASLAAAKASVEAASQNSSPESPTPAG